MEYCTSIWDPTLKKDVDCLERVQRKAARWACGKYGIVSVTALLKQLEWADLSDRRRNQRLILLYKSLHDLIAVPPGDVCFIRANRPPKDGLNRDKLQRPHASDQHSPLWHSLAFRTIPEWNNLPASIAEADSLDIFKGRLIAHKP